MREKYVEKVSELIAQSVCPIYRQNCDEYQPHTCTKCFLFSTPIGCLAEDLYNAGYRKAGDVAEQFKEIAKQYLLEKGLYLAVFKNALNHAEAELKKKYESEGADDANG